jgi:hypothetical protein
MTPPLLKPFSVYLLLLEKVPEGRMRLRGLGEATDKKIRNLTNFLLAQLLTKQ